MRFTDQTAFVSGAAHGIGAATARRLHAEGCTVVIADIDHQAAEDVASALGERAHAITCDVCDRQSVDAAFQWLGRSLGRLDHLVTVAGASAPMPPLEDQTDELWHGLIDLNLVGAMRCVRAGMPLLRTSSAASVTMVASVNGLAAWGEFPYGAAKAGMPNLAQNLTAEYGPEQIRFNVVAPGTIRARHWDPARLETLKLAYPLGHIGEPEDVAAAIAFLASADASWISGVTLPVDGGGMTGPRHLMSHVLAHRADASGADTES